MIRIIETGNRVNTRHSEFSFLCKNCGCKWEADRVDEGLHISPPCLPFYTYMNCPNCGKYTQDRKVIWR